MILNVRSRQESGPQREVLEMQVMVTTTYPTSSLPQVAKVLSETMKEKLPDYMKVLGWYTAAGGEGIESHTFYQIEDDNAAEGAKHIEGWLVRFFPVEGYKVKMEIVVSVSIEEAFHFAGKKES